MSASHPAKLWTRCFGAASKHLARALSPAVAWSFSASTAIVRPGVLVALLIVLAPVCLLGLKEKKEKKK